LEDLKAANETFSSYVGELLEKTFAQNTSQEIMIWLFYLNLFPDPNSLQQSEGKTLLQIFSDRMNESANSENIKSIQNEKLLLQNIFKNTDQKTVLHNFLSIMWYSKLPCFDIRGLTSGKDGEKSILKLCQWKGKKVPCSAIFKKVATDKGVCCAFNKPKADQIFAKSTYTTIIERLENEEKMAAMDKITSPDFNLGESELVSQSGTKMGLTVMLDAHTDLLAEFSVNSDFKGFTATVLPPSSFPLLSQNEFEIKPGHINVFAMTAIKLDADEGIRNIEPFKRNCYFEDEVTRVTLFMNYSQANCLLECTLKYAQHILQMSSNNSQPCTPWFLPFIDNKSSMCDPWQKFEIFEIIANQVPQNACSYCLPDCNRVIYQPIISTQEFRVCDEKNFGMTDLCSLTSIEPKPQIWGDQVLDQLLESKILNESNLKDQVMSSKRKIKNISLPEPMFTKLYRSYDAFEKDIAVLKVYFSSPIVMQYMTKESKTWFDFISTVGGNGGLFIGFSIVTILELAYAILRIINLYLRP
jgi:hypothetical protein